MAGIVIIAAEAGCAARIGELPLVDLEDTVRARTDGSTSGREGFNEVEDRRFTESPGTRNGVEETRDGIDEGTEDGGGGVGVEVRDR